MAAMPPPVSATVEAIYRAYEKRVEEHRPHLGASKLGHACERHLWYVFRWAETEKFDGRMKRLFGTGHLAEPRFIADLRSAGVTVEASDADGKQFRVSFCGNHGGGSMDGAGLGIHEAPKTWHVLEFKTHSQKIFEKLIKEGVRRAKPLHWAQCQVYMGKTGMTRTFYLAVNKNTDELYGERIDFDPVEFQRLMNKAERVIRAAEPPQRISADPSYFECKYCQFSRLCHGDQVPEVNCRTCAHSTPVVDDTRPGDDRGGRWSCGRHGIDDIPLEGQRQGCASHRYIPIALERTAKAVDYRGDVVVYQTDDGFTFANGDGTDGTFSSNEIRAAGGKDALAAPAAAELKRMFATAKVVG